MNSETNRKISPALIVTIALNVILASALVLFWRHTRLAAVSPAEQQSAVQVDSSRAGSPMNASGDMNANTAQTTDAADNESPLAPIQLTPQRMQAIGVKLGTVQIKTVSNDIRVTGNVDVNERSLATVQLRFPGWIRKVFVDATYDYVRTGQPLFTIYSPDLV